MSGKQRAYCHVSNQVLVAPISHAGQPALQAQVDPVSRTWVRENENLSSFDVVRLGEKQLISKGLGGGLPYERARKGNVTRWRREAQHVLQGAQLRSYLT